MEIPKLKICKFKFKKKSFFYVLKIYSKFRSILTPLNGRGMGGGGVNVNVNDSSHKYHSQILATLSPSSTTNQHQNHQLGLNNHLSHNDLNQLSVITSGNPVHLPPLQMNPNRFPERQRRTQYLQRQRLKKEYFH
jgi:hypothetical protein